MEHGKLLLQALLTLFKWNSMCVCVCVQLHYAYECLNLFMRNCAQKKTKFLVAYTCSAREKTRIWNKRKDKKSIKSSQKCWDFVYYLLFGLSDSIQNWCCWAAVKECCVCFFAFEPCRILNNNWPDLWHIGLGLP